MVLSTTSRHWRHSHWSPLRLRYSGLFVTLFELPSHWCCCCLCHNHSLCDMTSYDDKTGHNTCKHVFVLCVRHTHIRDDRNTAITAEENNNIIIERDEDMSVTLYPCSHVRIGNRTCSLCHFEQREMLIPFGNRKLKVSFYCIVEFSQCHFIGIISAGLVRVALICWKKRS